MCDFLFNYIELNINMYGLFFVLVSDIKGKNSLRMSETGYWGEY
jgi:hypothetical protein